MTPRARPRLRRSRVPAGTVRGVSVQPSRRAHRGRLHPARPARRGRDGRRPPGPQGRRSPGRAEGAAPAHRRRRRGARGGWPVRSARCERIRSRWIAEIVDADPWGPTPYVATRYVPGPEPARPRAAGGPDHRAPTWRWFARCLAEGVASVHAVGVLHRDVKPSNVLLEGRTPILIDFGLARVADDPKLTHTGWLLGTPGLPRARDPVRRRRDHRLRRALLGGHGGVRRHRPPAVRPRTVDGDHGPRTPRRARPQRAARRPAGRGLGAPSTPTRPTARASARSSRDWAADVPPARPAGRAAPGRPVHPAARAGRP